jgi:plastocyanin
MSNEWKLAIGSALALALLLTPTAAIGERFRIKATTNDTWDPDFRHIHKGDRIVWKNPADMGYQHDVKSYGGNWHKDRVVLDPGESTSKKFRHRGFFKFRCTIHSSLNNGKCDGMCGAVHVGPLN